MMVLVSVVKGTVWPMLEDAMSHPGCSTYSTADPFVTACQQRETS